MRTRSLVATVVVLFVAPPLTVAVAAVAPPPAAAGGGTDVIQVTTTDDEVDPGETVPGPDVSLREAVIEANGNVSTNDQIVVLAPGATYELDLCTDTGTDAEWGDLDANNTMMFTLDGNGATVRQTCADQGVLRKDAGTSQLVVDQTRITGGERSGVSAVPDVRIQNGSVIEGNSSSTAGGGVTSSTDVFIEGGSIVRGNVAGTSGGGAWAAATLTVTGSTVTGNVAGTSAGGVGAFDAILVEQSTISDNQALTSGGGIGAFSALTVVNSTIARNQAATRGGGIDNIGTTEIADTDVESSTLVANAAPEGANVHTEGTSGDDVFQRSIISLGSGGEDCALDGGGNLPDLVGGDESCYGILTPFDELSLHPMVAPPAANGGPTPTQRTVSPSRAIDAIPATGTPGVCAEVTDQRGVARPQGPACDAGAYEGVPAPCAPTFPDVSAAHPFFEDVCWLTQMGITGGFADGGYHPGQAVSRQAMAAFLYRLALSPPVEVTESVAADVPLGHPFLREIAWLIEEGISTGYGDETFRPLAPVTRQAMAAFLHRVAGEVQVIDPEQTFSDVPPSHPFFAEIEWMAFADVSRGFDDGTFRPAQTVSRQAMAAFLRRTADGVPLLGL